MNQNALLYAGLFDGAERAKLEVGPGRKSYVHVARGKLTVNGQTLGAGDALKAGPGAIALEGGQNAEVLVFDLP
jgi:hypothetical protein